MKDGLARWLLVLLVVALALAMAGSMKVYLPPVVTDEQNGQMITMMNGSVVDVRLHEQVHCGYTWAVVATDGLFLESDSSFPVFPEECMGIVPNPRGMHRFVIRAVDSGIQNLSCIYGSPLEPGLVLSRFNLTIDVIGPEHEKEIPKEENETKENETKETEKSGQTE
jgi:predicted secreted protein